MVLCPVRYWWEKSRGPNQRVGTWHGCHKRHCKHQSLLEFAIYLADAVCTQGSGTTWGQRIQLGSLCLFLRPVLAPVRNHRMSYAASVTTSALSWPPCEAQTLFRSTAPVSVLLICNKLLILEPYLSQSATFWLERQARQCGTIWTQKGPSCYWSCKSQRTSCSSWFFQSTRLSYFEPDPPFNRLKARP